MVLVTIGILALVLSSMRGGEQRHRPELQPASCTALNAGQIAVGHGQQGHRPRHLHQHDRASSSRSRDPSSTTTPPSSQLYTQHIKNLKLTTNSTSSWAAIIPYLLYGAVIILLFVWLTRRAQGQMSGIMSIGRSKAKVYTTERPRTTFADVAGYDGVKLEIREVVDFLRSANRFKEIGAKIPKGVLLVGPPGTGQDPPGPGGGGRGRRAVPVGDRLGLHGDVRRRRVPRGSGICSRRPGSRPRPSSSSTRSTPSAASGAPASAAATTSGSRPSTRCWPRWTGSRPPKASS